MKTSKNQTRKARRRAAGELKALAKMVVKLEMELRGAMGMLDYYKLELKRERGLEPWPPKNTIDGLSYWINRDMYGPL